jgi:succinate dehydrogenase / fumarate reductase cytochrome b subunit
MNMGWLMRFWNSTVGKKVVMALTGLMGYGFVVGHMLGNLQVFLGPKTINDYAVQLRQFPILLGLARAALIVAVALHIVTAVQLQGIKNRARPLGYCKPGNVQASVASRTMIYSGVILAVFLVYHLAHMTWGWAHPRFVHLQVYQNIISGFSVPVCIVYIAGVGLLALHLSHGAGSLLSSLGLVHPKYNPALRVGGYVLTLVVALGFMTVPVAVLAGVLSAP